MRRRVLAAAALAAVLLTAIAFVALPPRARTTPAPPAPAAVRGAYHIHSVRSDGSGTPDEIAEAAARAGLQFVVLTDHGNGTRAPDPPRYHAGVLVIDAVELNTTGGHLVVLGMPQAPYPLAGSPDAVIEDVHRLGGFGIAAHPGSPRPSLRWSSWQERIDGVEWLNADSEWRDERWRALGLSMVVYAFRPAETLASLIDRPDEVMGKWDALTAVRPVVALAGADAHARLGLRPDAEGEAGWLQVPVPGYEGSFRAFSNHVQLDAPWSGNAAEDARALLASIRKGRVFTVIDGLATPGGLRFVAASGGASLQMGDAVGDDEARLHADVVGPPGTRVVLKRGGAVVASAVAPSIDFDASGRPGAYRVEAYLDGDAARPTIPWMVSNPIYVGLAPVVEPPAAQVPAGSVVALDAAQAEKAPGSVSEVTAEDGGVSWRYALAPGAPRGQFAAVQVPVPDGLEAVKAIRLRVRAGRPARLWLQVRVDERDHDERWGTTFYADETTREIVVATDRLRPIGTTAGQAPPWSRVSALLVVADTVNTLPGASGEATIEAVSLVR